MNNFFKIFFIFLFTLCLSKASYSKESNCLQILHKNQQYSKMTKFLYGPIIEEKDKNTIEVRLTNANFGYSLKRVGVKVKNKTSCSLTYHRTILGTNETFKIECALINDTCRVYLDEKAWQTNFKK